MLGTQEALAALDRALEGQLVGLLLRPPPRPPYLGLWFAPIIVNTETCRVTRDSHPIAVTTHAEVDALLARETQRWHRENPGTLGKCNVVMLRSGGEWTVPMEKIATVLRLDPHFLKD